MIDSLLTTYGLQIRAVSRGTICLSHSVLGFSVGNRIFGTNHGALKPPPFREDPGFRRR